MKKAICTLVGFITISYSCFAEDAANDDHSIHLVGAYLGESIGTSQGGSNAFNFMARMGWIIGESNSAKGYAGVVFDGVPSTTSAGSTTVTSMLSMILAEYLAREAFHTGLYFGARAGLGLLNETISAGGLAFSGSSSGFFYGPVLGYEVPISKQVTMGIDSSWMSGTSGSMTIPGLGTINYSGSSALQIQAGVIYHF